MLANRLKEADRKLLEISGYRLRIVERAGLKLRSLLHKSDPWDGQKCSDPRCLICSNPYNKKFGCSKRNIAYKSVCLTCKDEAVKATSIKKDEKNDVGDTFEKQNDDDERPYIGESHVSGRERSIQHARDYSNKKDDSHQYKHYTEAHADLEMKDVKFGMTVLRQFFSSFNRQHYEAVMIFKHSNNLNSKSMLFNRCKIPRLQVMFDELEENKKLEKNDLDEAELDLEIEKLKQKHIREPGAEDTDPPPCKKIKRWHKFKNKKKKKQIVDEKKFEKESNLTETTETESLVLDPASNDLDSTKADDKETGSKKLFSIFDPNSVFVFNAKKNVKAATRTRTRRNKLRELKSNISIEKFLTKSRGN